MSSLKNQEQALEMSFAEIEQLIHQAEVLRAQAIAEEFGKVAAAVKKAFALFNDWVVEPFAKARKKNALYHELDDLDDRTLADLGITRNEIPYVVMNAFEGHKLDASEPAPASVYQSLAAAPIKTPANDSDQAIAA